MEDKRLIRPSWIRGRICWDESFNEVRDLLREFKLNSVCVEAACPNRGECWQARHVTFMILGDVCTRDCRFCDVKSGSPGAVDPSEPERLAEAIKRLAAEYVVITSVNRDDLADKGSGAFVQTVNRIKILAPAVSVELLIGDLDAREDLLRSVAFSSAQVIGHNIEMPEKLYPEIRPRSDYKRSMKTLRILSNMRDEGSDILVKSSIVLGMGEETEDILRTLEDLKSAGVDIVYMGQYLSPSRQSWPVKKYYSPREFKSLEKKAYQMGFGAVCAGPMVRSSYRAQNLSQSRVAE